MNANIFGELPSTVGHDLHYWHERGCTLDCRGPITIHPDSNWGFFVTVITRSHDITSGRWRRWTKRPVIVEKEAWIGSCALLYNCIVRERAIVAAGTVVRSCEIAPRTIVAGNPARVIARWRDGKWDWESPKWRVLE